ncbi:MAG: hypothetical protein M5U09_20130 [Gammaproteobacteria bacterium]|nr:hypothetical protein [Gammaproteobacteria bacterium]
MLTMGAFVGVLVGGVVAPRKKGTEEFSGGKNLRPLFFDCVALFGGFFEAACPHARVSSVRSVCRDRYVDERARGLFRSVLPFVDQPRRDGWKKGDGGFF